MRNRTIEHLVNGAISIFLSNWLVQRTPIIKNLDVVWAVIITLLLAAAFIWFLSWIRKIPPVAKVRKIARDCYYRIVDFILQSALSPKRYTKEERSAGKYREAIEEQIKNSHRVYFRLISGHTMFHVKDETFILDALRDLSGTEKNDKDIRIQLLSREAVSFDERAKSFIQSMEKRRLPERIGLEEYMRRCEQIEQEFVNLIGRGKVVFYKRKYLWRLLIFDDRIFISTYCDCPELVEGHLSPCYSFNRESDASLFDGFLAEFDSLYNKHA